MHLSWGMGATRRDVDLAPLPRRVRVRTSERRIAFLLGRAARDWKGKAERKKKTRARGSKNMAECSLRLDLKRVYQSEVVDCWISLWSRLVNYSAMIRDVERCSVE